MEKQILLIYFLVMICLGGCTVTPAPTQEIITPTPAATETETLISRSATPIFTKSPTSQTATFTQEWTPSETVTPSYTPTLNYLKYINQKCAETIDYWKAAKDFAGVSGKLFLRVRYSPYDYIFDFADFPRNEYNFIPKKGYKYITDYTASPDFNWFAYTAVANPDTDHEKSVLVVQSADSKTVKEFPYDYNEWTSSYWINNQWMGLVKYDHGHIEKITLFNPFTGEKKEMPTDYPDFAAYSLSGISYDPTLSRVIYHSHDESGDYFIYRELKNEQPIFKYPVTDGVYITPSWSPDGKSFVFVKGSPGVGERNELIRSDWDGNLSQLTDLSAYFASAMIYSVVWSPNSRYIALMVDVSSTQDPFEYVAKLFVMDVESKKVTEYCIPINDVWATIVWSPDSRYLATSSGNKDCDCSSAIVVDVETGEKAVMATGIRPVMWIK